LYLGAFTEFTAVLSAGTPPFTYYWDFGDGGIDTGSAPNHYYGSTGTYTYSVTITDSNGCESTCSQAIDIVVAPFVAAGFSSNIFQACDSAVVQFTDTTIGAPDAWFWDFGDGSTDTVQNPTHTYTAAGSYTVTLAATNGVYTDTIVLPNYVVVTVSPQANLSSFETFGCENITAQFLDESLGATSWHWDFGDGDTSNLQNPGHSYSAVGNYIITLIVSNNNFCYDTVSLPLNVYPKPNAGFTHDSACATDPIHFTDTSTIVGGTIAYWDWDFGDETGISGVTQPSHSYASGGNYIVSLVVTSDFGCADTIADTLSIFPKPNAGFSMLPDTGTILNPVISFTDQSTPGGLSVWNWDFGDGNTSSVPSPTNTYSDTGTYVVTLSVADTNGCSDTIIKTVDILPDYIFFTPNTFTPNGDGINDLFMPAGRGILETGYHFFIYNRWGDLLFETNDINEGWDGKANTGGKTVQADVYVWLIITKDINRRPHQYTGHVTLLK
jgi:gliding motility-associated-like protein